MQRRRINCQLNFILVCSLLQEVVIFYCVSVLVYNKDNRLGKKRAGHKMRQTKPPPLRRVHGAVAGGCIPAWPKSAHAARTAGATAQGRALRHQMVV